MSELFNKLSSDEESIHDSTEETLHVKETKKKKITFNEFVENQMGEFNKFKEDFDSMAFKDFNKNFQKFVRSQEHFMTRLIKMHEKNIYKKPRKHTENTGKSGFNKPTIVPKPFRKYLDLEDDTEMTRPQLVKVLNLKFQEDGFKENGHVCISDKKVAKMLGINKDHTFQAKDYHKFIATIYNSQTESTNA